MKKINSLAILSLIAFLLCSCQSEKKENAETSTIKGHIQHPIKDKIYFSSYKDSFELYQENKTTLDSALLDQNGNFSFSLKINNPIAFDLESGGKNLGINLFISPGDQLEINYPDTSYTPQINSSTEEGKFNAFLVNFQYKFFRDPEIKNEYYIGSNYMDGHNFATYNDRRKEEQLKFFSSTFEDDSLKKARSEYAMNTVLYGIGVDRLMYVWKKRMKNQTVVLDSNYFDFETKTFLENRDAMNCPAYIHFLKLYVKDSYERSVERGEIPAEALPQVEKYKLCINLLDKPFSDVVLYNILLSDMHDVSNKETAHGNYSMPLDSMLIVFRQKYSLQ